MINSQYAVALNRCGFIIFVTMRVLIYGAGAVGLGLASCLLEVEERGLPYWQAGYSWRAEAGGLEQDGHIRAIPRRTTFIYCVSIFG